MVTSSYLVGAFIKGFLRWKRKHVMSENTRAAWVFHMRLTDVWTPVTWGGSKVETPGLKEDGTGIAVKMYVCVAWDLYKMQVFESCRNSLLTGFSFPMIWLLWYKRLRFEIKFIAVQPRPCLQSLGSPNHHRVGTLKTTTNKCTTNTTSSFLKPCFIQWNNGL